MSKELLELHDEEIANIKYIFYKKELKFNEIIDDLNNILYKTSKISCTYMYVEDKCSYYIFIPHTVGETILAIQIKRVIKHIDLNTINDQHPIFHVSAIDSKYCIEILRHKGITEYKVIRSWLIKQLIEFGWIKEKISNNNINKTVDSITKKISVL